MTSVLLPWVRHDWSGTAQEFHASDLSYERGVWLCSVTEQALILGSTQSDEDIAVQSDSEVSIARRRSGGGAVFVSPTNTVWIDVTIQRDDPLWTDDVSTSMLWLGDAFVAALQPWVNAHVYQGVFSSGNIGRSVCFASSAPGEVFVGQQKLVGISQRRSRGGARFQCVMYQQWQPDIWSNLFASQAVCDGINAIEVATIDASAEAITESLLRALS